MNLELPTHELMAYGKSEYALKLAMQCAGLRGENV